MDANPISVGAQSRKTALNYGRSITWGFSRLRSHSVYYQQLTSLGLDS